MLAVLGQLASPTIPVVDPTDAGVVDAPFADADAGVYQVVSATLPDGGQLDAGWYLTDGRMQKMGMTIVALQNLNAKDEAAIIPTNNLAAYWSGVGSGVATAITIFTLGYEVFKK